MKCLKDEELMDQLLGEAVPGKKEEALEHLRSCPACRNRLAALNFARTAAAAVTPAPVSADFTARLMARISKERAAVPYREKTGIFKWFNPERLAFATCALTLFAAVFFHLGGGVPGTTPLQRLYLSDRSATPVRLAALTPGRTPDEPGEINYSDSCMAARCGL